MSGERMTIKLTDNEQLNTILAEVDEQVKPYFTKIEQNMIFNQKKVLNAFIKHQVSETDLNGTNGYGNDDFGREKLDEIYADIFHAEKGLVRTQFVSGTHTLSTALFGNLRPGDTLTYLTGMPYDTMQEVIGIAGDKRGSLVEWGVNFSHVPLKDGEIDFVEAKNILLRDKPKVVAIQRSRGYDTRQSFVIAKIKEMIDFVHETLPSAIVFIDNCYGEFSETIEPTELGANLMAGSLIKNPGGGLAQTGGYIVGDAELVENAAYHLTAPGIGGEEGATLDSNRTFYQGLFQAPHVVGQAIKGAIYTSALLQRVGLDVSPRFDETRTDLIQTVIFNDKEKMIKFIQAVQANSPIDSFVEPNPSAMAGYEDQVIMAAGTFVQGSTIEFSADGPIRPPYAVYLQGGLTFEHVKLAVINAVEKLYFA